MPKSIEEFPLFQHNETDQQLQLPLMTPESHSPIIVIGGGAAGLLAAWRCASLGVRVIVLERNTKPGIKILISGGGKCNITHAGDVESLRRRFIPPESRFLTHALYSFSNQNLLSILHERGVATIEREDGRIFPRSGHASDVLKIFTTLLEENGVKLRCGVRVLDLLKNDDGSFIVKTTAGNFCSNHVMIATGGMSYAKTGTTGDGYAWCRSLGHSIVKIRPALAPIITRPKPPAEWRGIVLHDCILGAFTGKDMKASRRGDLLFTQIGISGPAVLEMSREAYRATETNPEIHLAVDCVPEVQIDLLEKTLVASIEQTKQRKIRSLVDQYMPLRLSPAILRCAGIDPEKRCHQITKTERKALVRTVKHWVIGSIETIPLDRGEVTSGGVDLNEVDPKSMRSRIVKGLYLCGEVLDIAGPIGGYNLQAAFSTGYVAGESAAHDWKKASDS